jgi:glycosyltransferase involved in cell wall biosynthesis
VLIPTHNYARFLPATIESVLAQDCPRLEILLSDDASTDHSPQIVRHYAARDPRIRAVCHLTNLGMVAHWNWCLRQARGHYVQFLFGDDLLASPVALSTLAARLDAHPAAALASSARLLIDEHSRVHGLWDDLPAGLHPGPALMLRCLLRRRNLIGEPSAVMFRRAAAARGFDPAFRQLVDQEMWFHLLRSGPLVHTTEPLCAFRRHSAQQTAVNHRARLTETELLQLHHRYAPTLPLRPGSLTHRRLVFGHWHYLRRAARAGWPPPPGALPSLRCQLPLPWLALCWLLHRSRRPLENLRHKLHTGLHVLRWHCRPTGARFLATLPKPVLPPAG